MRLDKAFSLWTASASPEKEMAIAAAAAISEGLKSKNSTSAFNTESH